MSCLRPAVALLAALLGGCGYVADPLPPALNIPQPVTGLTAVERGERLYITFAIPPLTTEGLPVQIGAVELQVNGQTIPVAAPAEPGPVEAVVMARPLAGQTVTVQARVVHRRGRASEWAVLPPFPVLPPLPTPTAVRPEATASGVRLTWTGSGATYRVFRRGPADREFSLLGTSPSPPYTDATAQFDVPYVYAIQAVSPAGPSEALSERSEAVPFSSTDAFAPGVPTGLTVAVGIGTIELSWERGTEPDLAGYRVYREAGDGKRVRLADAVVSTVYSDASAVPGTRYRYAVTAVDQRGNESAPSAGVEAQR